MAKTKTEATKKVMEIIPEKEAQKVLKTKRSIDLHRDEFGNLDNVDISFDLDGYSFKNLTLKSSIFKGEFKNIKAQGVDFTSTELEASFIDSDLRWVTFTAAQKEKTIFINCNLRELNVIS